MPDGWTISEAAGHLHPPIPRRELARRLSVVPPVGTLYGGRGRRAKVYPVREIMRAHAEWVRERATRVADH